MRISDWSSDVCSSDLPEHGRSPQMMRTQPRACMCELSLGLRDDDDDDDMLRAQAHESGGEQGHGGEERERVGEGKGVTGRVDPGGSCIIKKKKDRLKIGATTKQELKDMNKRSN